MEKEVSEYCIMCGEKIFRRNNHCIRGLRRGVNCRTCSPKCSRVYQKFIVPLLRPLKYRIASLEKQLNKLEKSKWVKQK